MAHKKHIRKHEDLQGLGDITKLVAKTTTTMVGVTAAASVGIAALDALKKK